MLQASDRRSEGAALAPADRLLSCMATQQTLTNTLTAKSQKYTQIYTENEISKDTSPCTCAHTHFNQRRTHSSSCCRASQSRLCLTLPGVSSILSGEDEDEFLSYRAAIMVLTALEVRAGGFKSCQVNFGSECAHVAYLNEYSSSNIFKAS